MRSFITILGAFFLLSSSTKSQTALPKNAISIIWGYSRHGSGDMNGIVFGTEYTKYLSKNLSLNYNFRGSINDDRHKIIFNNNGSITDASIRFTTAGLQVGVNGQLSIVRNIKHEFIASLGAFGRYQSASNGSDGYSIYSPQATGMPVVLIGYDNTTPQRTYSLGGIFQLYYNYTLSNNFFIGLVPGFQTDTNGDVLAQVALSVGKRF